MEVVIVHAAQTTTSKLTQLPIKEVVVADLR